MVTLPSSSGRDLFPRSGTLELSVAMMHLAVRLMLKCLLCRNATSYEQHRNVRFGGTLQHQRDSRLFERLTDRATEAQRTIERGSEHDRSVVTDNGAHADDKIDASTDRLGLQARVARVEEHDPDV